MEQYIYDTGSVARANLADIGATQSGKIGEFLNTPYSLNTAISDKISGIQRQFLDPQWQQQQNTMEAQLANRGIRAGSEAYNNAMRDFSTNRQRAYDQSYLDAYNTAQSSSLAERNQPINEITALMSGSQVSNPSYASTPTPGVAPTDVIGANQMALNQQNMNYQSQMNNSAGLMSGLFGLGKTALGGWMFSDRKVKEDIKKVGKLDNGMNMYSYRYKGSPMMQLGVMADEVKKVIPEAVAEGAPGIDAVNYSTVAEKLADD